MTADGVSLPSIPWYHSSMKILLALILSLVTPLAAFELSPQTQQAIVGIAADWDATEVTLHLYEKNSRGKWTPVSGPWRGRLGSKGLAWGRGSSPVPVDGKRKQKREGDRRSPAGVFTLGGAWGYDARTNRHPNLKFSEITSRDLWVEDVKSKNYNRHIRLDHEPTSAWEKKQQMRQNDGAHALKIFIEHNAAPGKIVPGGGSSIFFHIWRAKGARATFGCTTMSEAHLRQLLLWVDPGKKPVYVLLPRAEYEQYRATWKLP